MFLKQSTSVAISFGPFTDATDGVTLETGLVSALDHASTGIKLSKNGGALTIRHATVTATTYDGYGNYIVTLDTTDTNTLGTLRVQYTDSATCLPVWADYIVLSANVYDSIVGGSDLLDVSVTQLAGVAQSLTDLKDFADDGYDPSTNKVQGVVTTDTATAVTTVNGLAAGVITAAAIADAAIDRATFAVDTGLQTIRSGTAQAGASGTITLDASASSTTDYYKYCWIYITGGTGAGQAGFCTAYNSSTKVASVLNPWVTNPNSSSTFAILPPSSPNGGDAFSRIGAAGASLTSIGDTRLANLDATVSSRMATFTLPTNFSALSISVAGIVEDTAGTTTLLNRLPNTISFNSGAVISHVYTINSGAITDDAFTVPTITGPATGILGFITQLWRRFFKKTSRDSTNIYNYADNGTDILTTQTYTSTETDEEIGPAS